MEDQNSQAIFSDIREAIHQKRAPIIIKNLFWCNINLNNEFISLELIILERESTMETK